MFIDKATVILCAVGVSDSMHSKYIVYMFDIWKYFNCEAFKKLFTQHKMLSLTVLVNPFAPEPPVTARV